MTEFKNLIAELLKDVIELQRLKEIIKITYEECKKPKDKWEHDRIILLVEIYASISDCHLEHLEYGIEKIEKDLSRKAKKREEKKLMKNPA